MDSALRAAVAEAPRRFPVQAGVEQVVCFEPVAFAPHLVDAVRAGAKRLGLSCMDIVSGAGHDAVYVARRAPTAMIFVPCKDGVSHNEIEDARPEHLTAGADVLLHAMLEQAGVVAPA
jgi:N-carbamoyl-L-amino-acid hydrolase